MRPREPASGGPTTVEALIRLGADKLPTRRGIPNPNREARWLLAAAIRCSETWLRIHPEATIEPETVTLFWSWIDRRRSGEPAEHLMGWCEFWGRRFRVSGDVLIPRPETEIAVDAALKLQTPRTARILDIGCGSGCIAVTLAAERPAWRLTAVDKSLRAMATARTNSETHGVRIQWILGDLATSVAGPFDVIVANLPYLPSAWLADLPEEVKREPRSALDGGADGLDLVRRLIADLGRILVPGGYCFLELAEEQAEIVRDIARSNKLKPAGGWKDAGGCERVVAVSKP